MLKSHRWNIFVGTICVQRLLRTKQFELWFSVAVAYSHVFVLLISVELEDRQCSYLIRIGASLLSMEEKEAEAVVSLELCLIFTL